jgi:hypothetical protein
VIDEEVCGRCVGDLCDFAVCGIGSGRAFSGFGSGDFQAEGVEVGDLREFGFRERFGLWQFGLWGFGASGSQFGLCERQLPLIVSFVKRGTPPRLARRYLPIKSHQTE